MVRPRLVEEGIPVGKTADETDDHPMADDINHHLTDHGPAKKAIHMSSLQSACGGKQLHSRGTKRATHIVIGENAALSNDDNCLHLQGPPHSWHNASIASSSLAHSNVRYEVPPHFNAQQYHNYHSDSSADPYSSAPPAHGTHIQIGNTFATENYPDFQSNPTLHQGHTNMPPTTTSTHPRHHTGSPAVRTHIEIGADTRPTERMEGIEDHSIKTPLVVFDGANIAYAYAQAMQGPNVLAQQSSSSRLQPDARGIVVAFEYFQSAGLRVSIVLPQSYFRSNKHSETTDSTLKVLNDLKDCIVAAPPTDDDDAYALTIAQRENRRVYHHHYQNQSSSHGFVLSNDLFRDAAARDETGELQEWLTVGFADGTGPGRISYAFCDMGSLDDYGDRQLDFVPNPRHPLIVYIESNSRSHVVGS